MYTKDDCHLEHFSLRGGNGLKILLALLLSPAKGPLHASALALVSCHLGFLEKVIWQQFLADNTSTNAKLLSHNQFWQTH